MSDQSFTRTANPQLVDTGESIANIGKGAIKVALIVVLGWIGAMKFTSYEAGAIEGLVTSSPLTSWLYSVFSLQGASNLIGATEIAIAALILIGFAVPRAAFLGALGAIATFVVTSSYLLTATIAEASMGGFPAISVVPGQFLLKDLVLLGASIYLAGDALRAIGRS